MSITEPNYVSMFTVLCQFFLAYNTTLCIRIQFVNFRESFFYCISKYFSYSICCLYQMVSVLHIDCFLHILISLSIFSASTDYSKHFFLAINFIFQLLSTLFLALLPKLFIRSTLVLFGVSISFLRSEMSLFISFCCFIISVLSLSFTD